MYSVTVFCLCLCAYRAAAATDQPRCTMGDQTLELYERRKIGSFEYECQKTTDYARAVIVGCVGEDGAQHEIGGQWKYGEGKFKYIYECSKDESGVTRIHVVYCLYDGPEGTAQLSDGQHQQMGDTLVGCENMGENGMQFTTSYNGNGQSNNANTNTITNTNTGSSNDQPYCTMNGQRLELNQRTTSGSFVYVCQKDGSSARVVIVGCVDDKKVEQPINGQWQVGDGKFKYIYECSKQSDGTTAIKGVYCLFQSSGGPVQLAPGQQQQEGKDMVGCSRWGELGLVYTMA